MKLITRVMRRQNQCKTIVISLLVAAAFLSYSRALAQETLRERIRERWHEKIKQKLSPPPYHPEKLQALEFGARERTYLLHAPSCYKKGTLIPLVFAFHGGGGTGEAAETQSGLSEKAEEACFIVVYPDGVSKFGIPGRRQYWASCTARTESRSEGIDDVGFISALIDKLSREYSIDPRMIYATGLSNGAQMSYRLACELSDKIAAIAPIGSGMVVEDCEPVRPVPVMHFHGTADPGWPYIGGVGCFTADIFPPVRETIHQWIVLNNCSENARVTYQKGGAVCRTHVPCGENAEVALCTIDGGGHVWPGGYAFPSEQKIPWDSECALGKGNGVGGVTQDINAPDAMWEFFRRNPKRTVRERN